MSAVDHNDRASAPRRLREALRRIDSAQLRQRGVLFAGPREVVCQWDGQPATFRFGARGLRRPGSGDTVELAGAKGALAVSLCDGAGACPVGSRDWRDFRDDGRVVAWGLAHRMLLDSMSQALGAALVPAGFRDGASLGAATDIPFDVSLADGARAAEGVLHVAPGLFAALIERSEPVSEQTGAEGRSGWDDFPVQLRLIARGPNVAAGRLQACRRGDAIVLGHRDGFLQRLRLATDSGLALPFVCAVEGDGIRILATTSDTGTDNNRENPNMAEQNAGNASRDDTEDTAESVDRRNPDGPPEASPNSSDVVSALPVSLSIELDRVTLPFSELQRMQPGQVLALNVPVEGASVAVQANGTTIGHGELVVAGDKLAVCITRWGSHGL